MSRARVETRLFIGGPIDGQERAILHGAVAMVREHGVDVCYRRMIFGGDTMEFAVWVAEGMAPDAVLLLLLTAYGRSR